MGLTFLYDATSVAPKSAQLQASMKLAPSSDVGNIYSSSPEPNMPNTTGRIPATAPFT